METQMQDTDVTCVAPPALPAVSSCSKDDCGSQICCCWYFNEDFSSYLTGHGHDVSTATVNDKNIFMS